MNAKEWADFMLEDGQPLRTHHAPFELEIWLWGEDREWFLRDFKNIIEVFNCIKFCRSYLKGKCKIAPSYAVKCTKDGVNWHYMGKMYHELF